MKQTTRLAALAGGAALAFASQYAAAQSSVTLWGVADVSVRYLTNANAKNDGLLSMTNGAITNSRFGIYGTEDLGGGMKALFKLESGVNLQNGGFSDVNEKGQVRRMFNRAAYVGLATPYGTVTLGRQKTPLFDLLSDTYDPLTVGNYFENAWLPVALGGGLYADNQIKYTGTFSGLTATAMYSTGINYTDNSATGFSGQIPGSLGKGNAWGFSLSYVMGPLSIAAGAQQNSNNSARKQTIYHANVVYAFSKVKVYAGYLRSKDDTGFVDGLLAQQNITVAQGTGRIDDGPFAGVSWQVTAPLTLTGAFYYDHMRNAMTANGTLASGNRYAIVGIAEYALSKRTEIYGTIDFNKTNGAANVELPGRSNQTGIAIGLRNIF